MKRTKIKDVLDHGNIGEQVSVQGWVRTQRTQKNIAFVTINDGSSLANLQAVMENDLACEEIQHRLCPGVSVTISGELVESPGKGQSVELKASDVKIYGDSPPHSYPIQKKKTSFEFLRTVAHLRSRTNTFGCVFRLRNGLSMAIHRFFQDRGFLWVHTPIISSSDCEGAYATPAINRMMRIPQT